MKKEKKKIKKEKNQVVEIHIYIHQVPYFCPTSPPITSPSFGTGKQPWEPPYTVC
jgi:hypothetical protein